MVKLSEARPDIATREAEPPIARYVLPLEEDRLRKSGRILELYGNATVSRPRSETGTVYNAFHSKQKRLIALNENDSEMERVLSLKKLGRYNIGVELTPAGIELYIHDREGLRSANHYLYPTTLIGIEADKAELIIKHFPSFAIYAISGSGWLKINRLTVPTLRIARELGAEPLLGMSYAIQPEYIDRVIME